MAVVGTAAVVQIKNVGQALLLIVFGTDVLFLEGAVRAGALARVMDPAHEVVVIALFADAREVCGERSTLHLVAFADGMAGEAAARFE